MTELKLNYDDCTEVSYRNPPFQGMLLGTITKGQNPGRPHVFVVKANTILYPSALREIADKLDELNSTTGNLDEI